MRHSHAIKCLLYSGKCALLGTGKRWSQKNPATTFRLTSLVHSATFAASSRKCVKCSEIYFRYRVQSLLTWVFISWKRMDEMGLVHNVKNAVAGRSHMWHFHIFKVLDIWESGNPIVSISIPKSRVSSLSCTLLGLHKHPTKRLTNQVPLVLFHILTKHICLCVCMLID